MKLEKASQEEMKQEAINRMKMLLLHQNVINEFKKENKLNKSEGPLGTLYWLDEEEKETVKEYEEKWNVLVYHVIKSFTVDMGTIYDLLYITDEKDNWEEERKRLEQGIDIFSWLYQREDLVLSIIRKDYDGYNEILKLYEEKIKKIC